MLQPLTEGYSSWWLVKVVNSSILAAERAGPGLNITDQLGYDNPLTTNTLYHMSAKKALLPDTKIPLHCDLNA